MESVPAVCHRWRPVRSVVEPLLDHRAVTVARPLLSVGKEALGGEASRVSGRIAISFWLAKLTAMPDIAVPFFNSVPASPPPWPGVVVLMEGDGISPQLLRVCQRLARAGYATIAPDLYWRFGGSDPAKSRDHIRALQPADGLADIVEAVEWLRASGASRVGATGFCMGGGYTYVAAVAGAIDAAAPFYGGGIPGLFDTVQCPLLAFFGGQDRWIPRDEIARVEAQHPGDVIVYEDAEHGFMRDGSESYHETAATDAWARLLAFFQQHLGDR